MLEVLPRNLQYMGGTSVCFNPDHPLRVIAFYRDVLIESQHIANTMEGNQVSRVIRIKLNFSSQLGDMNIKRTIIRTIFISPNPLYQTISGNGLVGIR